MLSPPDADTIVEETTESGESAINSQSEADSAATLLHQPCRPLAMNWLVPLHQSHTEKLNTRLMRHSCHHRVIWTPSSVKWTP